MHAQDMFAYYTQYSQSPFYNPFFSVKLTVTNQILIFFHQFILSSTSLMLSPVFLF